MNPSNSKRRSVAPAFICFDEQPERTDFPRPARPIGPADLGLNSRIDVYLHDGADESGEEYASRVTLRFDDEMVERAANALCDRQGSFDGEPTKEQYRDAEAALRAAFTPPEETNDG